jgi:hypothetical protein
MRITGQYFFNFVLGVFFLLLVVMGSIILETELRVPWIELTLFDIALLTLATWRLTALITRDYHTKWLREQFWEVKKVGKGYTLEKPKSGLGRTFADLFDSPWRMSLIVAGLVVFVFQLTAYSYYVLLVMAMSGVVSLLQIVTERLMDENKGEGL